MSGRIRFNDAFKKDVASQVVERGYSVRDVADRLGISTKSLYTWKAQFSKPSAVRDDEAALASELRRVKRELARVTEERDILKKATADFVNSRFDPDTKEWSLKKVPHVELVEKSYGARH